jgi:flagellar protein FliS
VQTADPGRLVLMLYDGAIVFLERALQAFGQEDFVESAGVVHYNISRARDILVELQTCLNREQGGEFADTMWRLYDYLNDLLTRGNCQKDPAAVHEVLFRVRVLRDAWFEMLQGETVTDPNMGTAPALSAVG